MSNYVSRDNSGGSDEGITISMGPSTNPGKKQNLEGYFIKTRTVTKKDGTEAKIHDFLTGTGRVSVWGTTDLSRQLAGSEPNQMTRVTFVKIEKIKNGKTLNKFLVEQDPSNVYDLANVDSYEASGSEDDSDELSASDDDFELETPTPALSTVARKSSTLDLLRAKKTTNV